MTNLKINILNYEDNSNPGWVKCSFKDIFSKEWNLVEKVPVVTEEYLDENSDYPAPGLLECEIVSKRPNIDNESVFTIDISNTYVLNVDYSKVLVDVFEHQLVQQRFL